MDAWKQQIDTRPPYWADYRPLIDRLPNREFPNARQLNRASPPGLVSGGGLPVKFLPAGQLPGVAYEKHIFERGEISTRESSWHDLFNALVWFRLPRIKAAMNRLHYTNLGKAQQGGRGKLRDALTLLDESGTIVASSNCELLEALAMRNWQRAFVDLKAAWAVQSRVVVCGHALLEKFLHPYKALTAHVVLLQIDGTPDHPADLDLSRLDEAVANELSSGELLCSTASLSPLPLMGIPGWYRKERQDEAFYADRQVFRPASNKRLNAPLRPLRLA